MAAKFECESCGVIVDRPMRSFYVPISRRHTGKVDTKVSVKVYHDDVDICVSCIVKQIQTAQIED